MYSDFMWTDSTDDKCKYIMEQKKKISGKVEDKYLLSDTCRAYATYTVRTARRRGIFDDWEIKITHSLRFDNLRKMCAPYYKGFVCKRKFWSTMGVELTWLNSHKWQNWPEEWCKPIARSLCLAPGTVSVDGNALEINTPPFRDIPSAKKFYKRCCKAVKKLRFVTHRNSDWAGGGHVHVALPVRLRKNLGLYALFLTNLYRDVQNRPWLVWMFNEAGDNYSAHPFKPCEMSTVRFTHPNRFLKNIYNDTVEDESETYRHAIRTPWTVQSNNIAAGFFGHKGNMIRVDSSLPTVEFRFFDMPKNTDQLEDHLVLANAYCQYIEWLSKQGFLVKCKVKVKRDVSRFAEKDKCVPLFKKFIEGLGLDWNRYKGCVENYYEWRDHWRKDMVWEKDD